MKHSRVLNEKKGLSHSLSTEAHIAHGYLKILSQLKSNLFSKPIKYLYTQTEQIKSTDKPLFSQFHIYPSVKNDLNLHNFLLLHKVHPFMRFVKSYKVKPLSITCSSSTFFTRGRPGTQRRWNTSSLPSGCLAPVWGRPCPLSPWSPGRHWWQLLWSHLGLQQRLKSSASRLPSGWPKSGKREGITVCMLLHSDADNNRQTSGNIPE